jgi:iron complex transport system permease protein
LTTLPSHKFRSTEKGLSANMHFHSGQLPIAYLRYTKWKVMCIFFLLLAVMVSLVIAVSLGSARLPLIDVARTLAGLSDSARYDAIVWNIRLPQAASGFIAGAGLAVSGAVMQSILRNPLGSPFTLGISHAAAFGAALSVMVLGSGTMGSSAVGAVSIANPYVTTGTAFVMSLATAFVIVTIARLRGATPELMVLTGVALGALFTAGTMFLQYFADDVQLAAMVFWSFGDTARATWNEVLFMGVVTVICSFYFLLNGWSYNAMEAGDETAKGLGVRVDRIRLIGMLLATLLTAVIISFLGIIGFVGLVVPHMVRRVIGADHRYLLPASVLAGGLLLVLADTAARMVLSPHILPVSVLTAFLGAPVFIWLIIRSGRP